MRSDVPIGTCLSGGFDSSSVVGVMAEINRAAASRERSANDWQHAVIASFPGQAIDETPLALSAARFAGVTPHLLVVDEGAALTDIDRILDDFDDVYVCPPTAPWLLYRELRRKGIVVSLDGHGADELMGFYRGADFLLLNDAPSWVSSPRENLRRAKLAMTETAATTTSARLSDRLLKIARMQIAYHPDCARIKKTAKSLQSLLLRLKQQGRESVRYKLVGDDDPLPAEWGDTNRGCYRLFHSTILPTILRNFERASMAHGIEVRMPFMDWRLVTYVMSLPDSSKIGGGLTKRVARLAMKGSIPEEIRTSRIKIGFVAPLPSWLNGPLEPWVRDQFREWHRRPCTVPFSVEELERQYEQMQQSGTFNWTTACEMWLRLNLLHFALTTHDQKPVLLPGEELHS
jgi:asparagine synthase (glutamine-hydrolysing)